MTKKIAEASAPSETVFAVSVSIEIAKRGGTRRRAGYTFARLPLHFATVPVDVLSDKHLRIREVPRAAGMQVVDEAAPPPPAPKPPQDSDGDGQTATGDPRALADRLAEIEALNKGALEKLATEMDLSTKGTKADIFERVKTALEAEAQAAAEAAEAAANAAAGEVTA